MNKHLKLWQMIIFKIYLLSFLYSMILSMIFNIKRIVAKGKFKELQIHLTVELNVK